MLSANRSGYLGCALALLLAASFGHAGPNAGLEGGGGGSGDIEAVGDCATGTCFGSATANTVLAGPSSGGAAAASMRALVDADIPDTITWRGTTLHRSGATYPWLAFGDVLDYFGFDVDEDNNNDMALWPLGDTTGVFGALALNNCNDANHCWLYLSNETTSLTAALSGDTKLRVNNGVIYTRGSSGSENEVSNLGQTIGAAEIADGDHGDFTYSSGTATLDAGVVGDAEMATTEKIVQAILLSATASDSVVLRTLPVATSVTRVECETFGAAGTETATIEICLGDDAGDDTCATSVNGGTIVCDADGQADTVIANPALTARQQISVVISAVSGTVDALEVYVEGTR